MNATRTKSNHTAILTVEQAEAIKRRLKKQEEQDIASRARTAKLAAYAKKSNAGIAKGQKGKKRKDLYAKGRRVPGSAFSKSG